MDQNKMRCLIVAISHIFFWVIDSTIKKVKAFGFN
jgi:hypothetical protein